MSIRGSIGFGILLAVLAVAAPAVLSEGIETAVVFLDGVQASTRAAAAVVTAASTMTLASTTDAAPLLLPQAPLIR